MPEIETIIATTAPKRRRAARKAAPTVADATPRRSSRAGKKGEQPSTPAETPPPARARASRSRGRRSAAAPPPSAGLALATGPSAPEGPPAAAPAETGFGHEAQPTSEFQPEIPGGREAAPESGSAAAPAASSETTEEPPRQPQGNVHVAHDPDPRGRHDTDVPRVEARHPFSRSRPARPTFKQMVLRAAEARFRGDRVREPVTEDQVDEMLVLLHEPEQSRSLKDATYDFLRRGMSRQHAEVQIEKLRGTYVPRDGRAAA